VELLRTLCEGRNLLGRVSLWRCAESRGGVGGMKGASRGETFVGTCPTIAFVGMSSLSGMRTDRHFRHCFGLLAHFLSGSCFLNRFLFDRGHHLPSVANFSRQNNVCQRNFILQYCCRPQSSRIVRCIYDLPISSHEANNIELFTRPRSTPLGRRRAGSSSASNVPSYCDFHTIFGNPVIPGLVRRRRQYERKWRR